MWRMSEPPRDLATSSVEELRVALERQRAINTELRTVIAAQAELHQAELAKWRRIPVGGEQVPRPRSVPCRRRVHATRSTSPRHS